MNPPRIIFITGPTASGKSAFAMREAERTGAAILSCDSLCVYRGMDIGTAKPTREDQLRVPHYGIDLVEPDQAYSVADYIAYRDGVLQRHRASGQPLLVVGGSGFYLKSFFTAVTDAVAIPEAVAARVAALREAEGADGLLRQLRALHAPDERFDGLDTRNPRRLEKALMRCLATGRSHGELRKSFAAQPEPLGDWNKEVWLINRDRGELQRRNRARVEAMLRQGLIEEVRSLRQRGIERNPSARGAIGYREVLAHLDRPQALEHLTELIVTHTNQLMRRQRTWFRHQIPLHREIRPANH
jgi:tRNA dimethylallyltransferase